ncbi:hypothetical protein EJB05_19245, partial [Eragrostis curvula]
WRRRTTPPPVFRFASSLRALRIGNCTFPSSTAAADAPPLRFPHLELISFCSINISEAALHGLIASCPNLVTLVLDECMGFAEVMINSSTLRTFAFSAAHSLNPMNIAQVRMHRVVIENAPRLENLAQFRHPGIPESFELLVASAPKLKFLGCISKNISRLELGTTVFKVTNCRAQHLPNGGVQSEQIRTKMQAVTLGATLRTVKSLALEDVDRTNVVCSLLRCFPCLEKLYISSTQGFSNSGSYDEQIPVECLELCLRTIVLSGYDGKKPADVRFARLFVRHARVLEFMRIRCRSESFETFSEEWITDQKGNCVSKRELHRMLSFVSCTTMVITILTYQSISMIVCPRGMTHLIHGLSNSTKLQFTDRRKGLHIYGSLSNGCFSSEDYLRCNLKFNIFCNINK